MKKKLNKKFPIVEMVLTRQKLGPQATTNVEISVSLFSDPYWMYPGRENVNRTVLVPPSGEWNKNDVSTRAYKPGELWRCRGHDLWILRKIGFYRWECISTEFKALRWGLPICASKTRLPLGWTFTKVAMNTYSSDSLFKEDENESKDKKKDF